MEITLHTGLQGDRNIIHVNWFDENGTLHDKAVEINVDEMDKPRTVVVKVDGEVVANIVGQHATQHTGRHTDFDGRLFTKNDIYKIAKEAAENVLSAAFEKALK